MQEIPEKGSIGAIIEGSGNKATEDKRKKMRSLYVRFGISGFRPESVGFVIFCNTARRSVIDAVL